MTDDRLIDWRSSKRRAASAMRRPSRPVQQPVKAGDIQNTRGGTLGLARAPQAPPDRSEEPPPPLRASFPTQPVATKCSQPGGPRCRLASEGATPHKAAPHRRPCHQPRTLPVTNCGPERCAFRHPLAPPPTERYSASPPATLRTPPRASALATATPSRSNARASPADAADPNTSVAPAAAGRLQRRLQLRPADQGPGAPSV